MSDLIVLSACWDPISKAAHKYVRPHCVISLLRPDIEGSSQIGQTSHSVISLLRPDIEGSSQICQTSQCYQPVETRYRRQLTNMSDLTVSSACWDPISKAAHRCVRPLTVVSACWNPISKAAHKYVRPHSVISLLRLDIEGSSQMCQTSHSGISLLKPVIEGSSQICQTSQCYQPVETRYRRQLTDMSDLSQCYQPVETRYRRQLTNMSDLTVLSACWGPISKAAHKYVRSHSVISLLRPDIEDSSQIFQTSQCYQPVETRYRRQLTNMSNLSQCYQPVETRYRRQLTDMSYLTVLSSFWDPISKAAHKYVRLHSVICLLRHNIPLVSVYLTLISDLLATINSPYCTCHSRHSRTAISYQLAWCT